MERVSRKEETRYKIVIVGDVHVGKTTLFCKYVEGEDLIGKEPIVTVIDFKRKQIKIDDKDIQLYIWDTAGQEKFRSIVSTYFKGCDGIMLVFDLSDASSFANATSKWYQLVQAKSPSADILLVGSKSDLGCAVSDRQIEEWCLHHNCKHIKTSVKDQVNVDESFALISKLIYHKLNKPIKTESFSLSKPKQNSKSRKCC